MNRVEVPYMKHARHLSYVIASLAVVASAGGLWLDGLYRDNAFVSSTWIGNDWVTLLVAAPLLVLATAKVGPGALRTRLVWMGMLDYMLYNYAFYLFGTAFNWFFFLYVLLFGLSAWALVIALLSFEPESMDAHSVAVVPARVVAGFMLLVGVMLTGVYFTQWLGFATGGDLPPIVTVTGHPTNVVFALDLSLVVPVLLVGAVLLLRRRPWGYVLAGMGNVKGSVYMLALSAATISAYRAGTIDAMTEVALGHLSGSARPAQPRYS